MSEVLEDLTVTEEMVWVPITLDDEGGGVAKFYSADAPSEVTVEKGVSRLKAFEIGVVGEGSETEGTIQGKVTSSDYKALYKVYDLKETDSVDVWILNYKRDKSRQELKKASEESNTSTQNVNLKFKLRGNNKG